MSSSRLRSDDRQRLRAEVEKLVRPLPLPYALEAVAKRLEVSDGRFDVSMKEGFLRQVTRFHRPYDLRLLDGRMFPFVGDETFTPDRLWKLPFRPTRRIGLPAGRIATGEDDPEPDQR